MKTYIKRFTRNVQGRDFAIGDIHGCFSKAEQALAAIRFDPACDRLFSVGDLIDRGPQSGRVLEWLDYPWFHAIQGNHEQLAIFYTRDRPLYKETVFSNGGAWLLAMLDYEQQQYADHLDMLPYFFEIETEEGLIGIVHADVLPYCTWGETLKRFEAIRTEAELVALTNQCLWSRKRYKDQDESGVPDLRALVVGHTPLRGPTILGNVHYIDTKGWKDGQFTLLQLGTLEVNPNPRSTLKW